MARKSKTQLAVGGALVGAALIQQLRRPPAERTWHGKIIGIPYDFRRPTLARLRAALWNPANPSFLAPKAFGLGWDINLYRLLHPGRPARLAAE